jgi:glutathione synthase/RimK-type ligase-like ATP-grasp enzyme
MAEMTKAVATIGRQALIDMPVFGIAAIPAKVDTGADSSAIWASSIKEHEGILSFVLFDRDSPCYTGEIISTDKFEIVSIRNSFGKAEYRYKVKLLTKIEGRNIKVQYTLSDRSHSKYPVLIGRNTLRGRFVVDVSKQPVLEQRNDRMLLLSVKRTENIENMVRNIERYSEGKVSIDYAIYEDLVIRFKDGIMSVAIEHLNTEVKDYSLVHFKTSIERDITAAIARYILAGGGRIVDDAVQNFPGMSKLYQYSILSHAGIRVPDSVFVVSSKLQDSYDIFVEELGLPFVLKGLHASRGALNVVIDSKRTFNKAVKEVHKNEAYVVAQKFIPNKGDYRVLVFGKQIYLVIHRVRKDDTTHLNNTSAGGTATIVPATDLPSKIQTDSIHAAAVMGRRIAGVDAIQDADTGEWLFLEVNDGPQLATGAFIDEKHQALAKFFAKELEK